MTPSETHHHGSSGHPEFDPMNWDERYASTEQLWSGAPNGALVDAVSNLKPGRVLDVGCGEGADAIWLARNGWDVTGLDISGVALECAALHAREAGVSVAWIHAGLAQSKLPAGSFDLVSAQYPVLKKSSNFAAEHTLLDSVASDGTIVFVHHADFHSDDPNHHGFNPADYVGPWDLAPFLGRGWHIDVNETRPRVVRLGAGAGHSEDVVIVARRTG